MKYCMHSMVCKLITQAQVAIGLELSMCKSAIMEKSAAIGEK